MLGMSVCNGLHERTRSNQFFSTVNGKDRVLGPRVRTVVLSSNPLNQSPWTGCDKGVLYLP